MSDMRVKARTNGQGLAVGFDGFDMHNMRPADIHGKKLDPWKLIERAEKETWHPVSHFFAVNAKGNSIHPYLDRYNMLINYIVNELGVDGTTCDHEVLCSYADGAKQIIFPKWRGSRRLEGARAYLCYGGKIYVQNFGEDNDGQSV